MNESLVPIVSIVVPCYNQAVYLGDALDSVLNQTFDLWECIIVNDGSTDNTKQVALQYCDKDRRFSYVEQHNAGLSAARNMGVKCSKGEFILPLDSDDKIDSEYLFKAVSCFKKDKSLSIVYCRAAFWGKRRGEWILPPYSLERMLGQNCIFCSAFYRRTAFDEIGGYNVNMKYGYEDWDFWLSIIERGGNVYKIDDILFYYRIRKKSMARSLDKNKMLYLRRKIWENHRQLYANTFWDITESFEYCLVAQSLEYKVGCILMKPIRLLYNLIYK